MDLDGEYIHRFDTSINGIDLSKRLVSTNHNALGYFSVKSPDKYETGPGAWFMIMVSLLVGIIFPGTVGNQWELRFRFM